jgi:hypothetical protein
MLLIFPPDSSYQERGNKLTNQSNSTDKYIVKYQRNMWDYGHDKVSWIEKKISLPSRVILPPIK